MRSDVCETLRIEAIRKGHDLSDGEESEAILGVGGQIYIITAGPVAYRVRGNYAAIGSGSPFAEGALYATQGSALSIKERLTVALEAAEQHCSSVRGPWEYA